MERSRKKSRRCIVSSRIGGFSSNELAMYSWTRLFWNWKAFSCRRHSGQNWFLFCLLWFQALCRQSTIKQATNFAQCLLLILMIITTRSHTWLHPDIFLGLTEIYLVYHSNKIEVHSSWDLFFQANIKPSLPSRSAVSITCEYLWTVQQSLNFWSVWFDPFPKTNTPQEFVPGIQIIYPF